MKICPKCNTGNDNHAVTCKDCGKSLTCVDKEDRDFLAEITAREEKKHRKIMRIHKVFLPIAVVMYAFLFIKAIMNYGGFEVIFLGVLFPILSYFLIHHAKGIFVITHVFTVENPDEADVTDFYVICNRIGGILCLIGAFSFLFIYAFIAKNF